MQGRACRLLSRAWQRRSFETRPCSGLHGSFRSAAKKHTHKKNTNLKLGMVLKDFTALVKNITLWKKTRQLPIKLYLTSCTASSSGFCSSGVSSFRTSFGRRSVYLLKTTYDRQMAAVKVSLSFLDGETFLDRHTLSLPCPCLAMASYLIFPSAST